MLIFPHGISSVSVFFVNLLSIQAQVQCQLLIGIFFEGLPTLSGPWTDRPASQGYVHSAQATALRQSLVIQSNSICVGKDIAHKKNFISICSKEFLG
jgi:hypothetical protein